MIEAINPKILALSAALFIAVARMFYQSALSRLNPTVVTAWVNYVSVLFAAFLYWMSGGVERWPVRGLIWFVSVGLIGSLFGRYMSFVARRLAGVTRTSVVMQSVLVWSTALAVIFLGESLTIGAVSGSILIMIGGALLVREKAGSARKFPLFIIWRRS